MRAELHTPRVRYAAIGGYAEVASDLGLDPVRLMREQGLDATVLDRQDEWVPAVAIARLLEASAGAAGRRDIGVRLAELRHLSNLGPISLVLREEPDVRGALALLQRYERTFNESLHTRTIVRDGLVTIQVDLELGEHRSDQALELAIAAVHQLLQEMIGEDWSAVGVYFPHPAPADSSTHERLFGGSRITFGHAFGGVVLRDVDLDHPLPGTDPQLREYAHQFLRSLGAGPEGEPTSSRVHRTIERLLPVGRCTVDAVARDFGVDRRTLHRHLAAEGETFTDLVDAVRTAVAERLLRGGQHSVTEVSEMLGFSAPSGLSRWFRQRYGCSPSEWRSAQA